MFRNLTQKLIKAYSYRNMSKATTNGIKKTIDLQMDRIVWMDMEMSGLNINTDRILEVACLITDSELNILAEGPDLIVHQDPEVLNNMNEWCMTQHALTGLTKASEESQLNIETVENRLLEFIKAYVGEKETPLAGNSVYMDRLFMKRYMPKVDSYLHYRLIDVSTVRELCKRWNFPVYRKAPKKDQHHRALSDIKESIKELRYYKETFFKSE